MQKLYWRTWTFLKMKKYKDNLKAIVVDEAHVAEW
jgi:hypothetical protein